MKIGIHNNLRHTQNSDVVGVASAAAAAASGGVDEGGGLVVVGGLWLWLSCRVGAVGCGLWVVGR